MGLSNQFSFLSAVVLVCSSLLSTASAELVIFKFTGVTQATIDGKFFDKVDFTALVSIDDATPDDLPFETGRGSFSNAITTLSIPDAGIFDLQAENVTGLLQEDFGSSSYLKLGDSSNLFGQSALAVAWGESGVFTDVNSINPLIEPLSDPDKFQGGLPWKLLLGPEVTFNSVFDVSVANVSTSANVPEPTSFTLCGIGLLAVAFKRRRR